MDFFDDPEVVPILMAVMGVILVAAFVVMAFSLVLYILRSIGIMTIAKNRGTPYPWLVWIPIVGSFTIGAVADDIESRAGRSGIFRYLMLGGAILTFFLSDISTFQNFGSLASDPGDLEALFEVGGLQTIGSLVGLAYYIITVISLNRIYKCYRPQSATAFTVWSAIPLTAFMQSIFPFVIRNDSPKQENYTTGEYGGYPPQ